MSESFARSHEMDRSRLKGSVADRQRPILIYLHKTKGKRAYVNANKSDRIKPNRVSELTARELHKRYRSDFQLPHIRALRRASNTCAYDSIASESSAPTTDSSSIYFKTKPYVRGTTFVNTFFVNSLAHIVIHRVRAATFSRNRTILQEGDEISARVFL